MTNDKRQLPVVAGVCLALGSFLWLVNLLMAPTILANILVSLAGLFLAAVGLGVAMWAKPRSEGAGVVRVTRVLSVGLVALWLATFACGGVPSSYGP